MVRFLDEQDERDHRGRRPSPTRSHHSGRDRDYSPDFISGPGRVPRPYASGAIPSTATAHQPPPPVPSPPLSPPIPSRTGRPGGPGYVYDDDRDRDRDRNGAVPLRGRDRSWERGSGTGSYAAPAARNISVSRSRSRSRGPAPAPGTRERHIVRETKIYGGPEFRDPERAAQALAVSDARRAHSPSRDSRASRDLSRSRSRSRGARSIYTTDDDSDYPRSRGVSHSRRRSPSSSSRRRSPSSRSRSRRSPSPLRKAKDVYSSTFSPSTAALGVGVLGAIVGGLAAREATEHARKSHKSHDGKSQDGHSSRGRKEEERERKAALISTIVGAAVGGLGANVIEKKFEEKKRVEEEERRARERGGYRELRDRDLDDDYRKGDRDGRSRSRHRGSLDTPAYSDEEGYYGNSSRYGSTTVRGGR